VGNPENCGSCLASTDEFLHEVVAVVAVILVIVWYVRVASKPCVNPEGARNHPVAISKLHLGPCRWRLSPKSISFQVVEILNVAFPATPFAPPRPGVAYGFECRDRMRLTEGSTGNVQLS